jgi:hypothetical protein
MAGLGHAGSRIEYLPAQQFWWSSRPVKPGKVYMVRKVHNAQSSAYGESCGGPLGIRIEESCHASLRKSILFRIPHSVAAFGRAVNTKKLSEPDSSLKQTFNHHSRYQKAPAPGGIAHTGRPCPNASAASASPLSGTLPPHIALANPIFMTSLTSALCPLRPRGHNGE